MQGLEAGKKVPPFELTCAVARTARQSSHLLTMSFIGGSAAGEALPVEASLVDVGVLLHPGTPPGAAIALPRAAVASGDGSVGFPSSSDGSRTLKSLETAHSKSCEAEASVAFWKFTHAAFPGAALESVHSQLMGGQRLISNRNFTASALPEAFAAGREAFIAATLIPAPKHPPPAPKVMGIDFSLSALFTKGSYEQVEADCLLKLPALVPCDWTKDPAALDPPRFIAPAHQQALPDRQGPSVQTQSGGGGQASGAARSRFSSENYPENSAMYVVGEVYAPLASMDSLRGTVQKLLQAERTLQFLVAKEGKPLGDCVLGMVFMGPHMDKTLTHGLFLSLEHYQTLLPCLWSLYEMRRLLAYHMRTTVHPVVEAHLTATALAQLTAQFEQQQQQQQLYQQQQQQQLQQQRLLLQQLLDQQQQQRCCSLM